MLTPVGIRILLLQLPFHLRQLAFQVLNPGFAGLCPELLLQFLPLRFQLLDLTIYLVAIAFPDLVLVLFSLAPWSA